MVPSLSGTSDQSLKGDLEALQPEQVATQPKDSVLKVFKAFDGWLRQTAGRSAREVHRGADIQSRPVLQGNKTHSPAMYPLNRLRCGRPRELRPTPEQP